MSELNEPLQIVCGAANVRAGIHVPVATVGAVLPAVGLTIKAGELRGVASNGMICSLSELGLATESDGIAILEDLSDASAETGTPVAPLLGLDDTVLGIGDHRQPSRRSVDGGHRPRGGCADRS